MKLNDKLHGFIVTGVHEAPFADGTLIQMRHEKTGARLNWMKSAEENKLFSIAFKTIPQDDTGVFHILEHSVLGGSKKYPVKEPFLELMKSSMNTFLNAMTFPDKTIFPVSSRNDTDFMNLTEVYLDAVFDPAIYYNPSIFHQEGWHVEMRKEEDEPLFKGVVFNEMKGALSDVQSRMFLETMRTLFPDTCYGFESGGDPASIPDLTYENFLANHREFYHPSNAYIYLDGDMDISRVLALIGEYLSRYEASGVRHDIPFQAPIAPTHRQCEYEIAPEEEENNKTHLALGKVLTTWRDREKLTALKAIADALAGSNDAPLKRALLDTGLCRDVTVAVEDSLLQPLGMLAIMNTDPQHTQALINALRDTVAALAEKGINREDLSASLNRLEFNERAGDEPKGLIRNISMLTSWLHDDEADPLMYLSFDELFASLREKLNTGYYEELMKEWLLEEEGRATLTMLPSRAYGEKLKAAEDKRLKDLLSAWTAEDKARIIDENRRLDEWQQSIDTPEQLATMPRLPLKEVSDKPLALVTREDQEAGVLLLRHPAREKGLVGLNLYFSLADCDADQLSQLAMMAHLLGSLPTQRTDGPTLQRKIKSLLGRVSCEVEVFGRKDSPETCRPYFLMKTQFLEHNLQAAQELIAEILTQTDFSRIDTVGELLLQADEDSRQMIIARGNRYAMRRAQAALSAESAAREITSGFEAYKRLHRLVGDRENSLPAFAAFLGEGMKKVFVKERLIASVTAAEDVSIGALLGSLPSGQAPENAEAAYSLAVPQRQGILIPAPVSYSGYALPRPVEDLPAWNVAASVLSLEYLWNEVRVKGGAYGAGATVNRLGEVAMYSFRDPSPDKSIATCRESAQFLRQYCADSASLDQYIISTIAEGEPLQSDAGKGLAADALYFRGVTEDQRLANRRRMLSLTPADIAPLCSALEATDARLCVVAAQEGLDACDGLTVESI